MMTIKAVFFDIDGTLFSSKDFAAFARKNAVRAIVQEGLKLNEEEVYSALMRIVEKHGSNYPFHFNELLASLGISENPRYIAAAVRAYHDSKLKMRPYPQTKKVLRKLKSMGLDLYIASRGIPVKQWDKLIRLGLHKFFNEVFVSDKKDVAFYRRLLGTLGLASKEALMVGDREDEDMLPALQAGFYGVLIAQEGRTKRSGKFFVARDISELPKIIRHIIKRDTRGRIERI